MSCAPPHRWRLHKVASHNELVSSPPADGKNVSALGHGVQTHILVGLGDTARITFSSSSNCHRLHWLISTSTMVMRSCPVKSEWWEWRGLSSALIPSFTKWEIVRADTSSCCFSHRMLWRAEWRSVPLRVVRIRRMGLTVAAFADSEESGERAYKSVGCLLQDPLLYRGLSNPACAW